MSSTSNARELLHELLERGARVWAEGGELVCQLAPEALTAELRQALRAAKGELLTLLGQHRQHVRLSYAQERLWFLEQLAPGDPAFHLSGARRLQGPLDTAALERALAEVVRRHESLRTTFGSLDGRPFQVVTPPSPARLARVDLTALPDSRRREEARRRLRAEARRPFDLVRGPLMRTALLALAGDEHVLFVNLHHIVSDGWSQGVFNRELAALYAADIEGRPSPLPPLSLQYADYAVWQRQWLRGEVLEGQLAYWRRQLEGTVPAELPADRPRPARRSYRAGVLPLALSERRTHALRRLGATADASLFMTLLAAFLALLSRFTGQTDVAVGSPIANRHRLEVEGLIGFFLNTLVLRGEVSAGRGRREPTFREVVGRLREVCLAAYEHQDLPIEMLLEELETGRDVSRSPLFQILFIAQNPSAKPLEMPGLEVSPFRMGVAGAQFDLVASLTPTAEGIHGTLSYDEDLFERATIARFSRCYTTLLVTAAEDPDRAVSDLPWLGAAERHQVLREWSDGERSGSALCLHELFEAQAERTPEAVALLFGDERWSYGELDRCVRRTGRRLEALGVGPEVRVGISIERSPAMVAGVLAVLRSGGAYVPLDPDQPVERLLFLLSDSGAEVLLTSSGLLDRFAAADPGIRRVVIDGEPPSAGDPGPPVRRATPRNLAYVIYTSGSSGRPKAVAVEHRSAVHLARFAAAEYPIEAGDRVLQFASLGFDTSVEEIFPALAVGATLVLWNGGAPAAGELLDRLGQLAVTVLDLPTAYWHELVAQAEAEGLVLPPSLRLCILGGERASGARLRGWHRLASPSLRLLNSYGPTEATVVSTWCVLRGAAAGDPPIGRPLAGVAAYVLDRGLRPVPWGAAGELCLGGAGLARGYLGRPALTAGRFVPHPLSEEPGRRLYRTGDLVRWRGDAQLAFLGRADRQVKVRGYRIEPGEVEAALLAHPGVRQAAVVERRTSGSEPASLAGFYVAEGGESAEELRRFLAARLPSYMVPAFLLRADELPATPGGKVDRRALATLAEARSWPEAAGAPPRTPTEEILTEIWAELLEVRGIGVRDDFFHLGGHSLLATQMVSRIRRIWSLELPIRTVFERPTLAALAAEIDDRHETRSTGQGPPIPPLAKRVRSGETPLSFAQQRLWFLQQLTPSSSVYNLPYARRLRGPLDAAALAAALGEVVRRHETLRTRFPMSGGRPRQEVVDAGVWILPLVDLTALPLRRRAPEARHGVAVERRRPFRLAEELPLRSHLWRIDAEEHLLLVNTHHVAADGWSQGIFNRELTTLYDAFARGEASPLPEPRVQYADFALWQREWLRGEILETQLGYWRRQLEALRPLELPADRPRPATKSDAGRSARLALSAELAGSLRRHGVEAGTSLFMTLLAAFVALLHRLTGQDDVAVGSPIAHRRLEEVEDLIGFFANTLVLRNRPAARQVMSDLLSGVRESCLDAYLHQDVPFEKLVEELEPERDLGRSPLFQVMLVLQNAPARSVKLSGLEISLVDWLFETSPFDLTVSIGEGATGGLGGWMRYATDLFDATTILRFARAYEVLLAAVAEDPRQRLGDLATLSAAERHQLLREWNERPERRRPFASVVEWFEAQAAATPDAPAVAFAEADGRIEGGLTYRQLDERANQLARALLRRPLEPNARVGLCFERSAEMTVALLGILKAGAAYVPLDPAYPLRRLAFMAEETRMSIVVTQESLGRDRLGALGEATEILLLEATAMESTARPGRCPDELELAYVIYTSGSTGRPKGVAMSHGVVAELISWHLEVLLSGVCSLQFASLTFDGSFHEIFATWCSGGCLVVVAEEVRRDPGALLDVLASAAVEKAKLPVVMLQRLAEEHLARQSGELSLRELTVSGSQLLLTPAVVGFCERHPRLAVHNHYGPSETHAVTGFPLRGAPRGWPALPAIGRPISVASTYVLDAHLRCVPIGVEGEVHIGGRCPARGYFDRPALSAQRFVPDPFTKRPGGRLYRTGDRGRHLGDGNLRFLGRWDHQVKLRGFRVELGEVEAVLAELPGVREAAVVCWSPPEGGEPRLVAYVAGRRDGLQELLSERLPDFMLPSAFVFLDALPVSTAGKVDRAALPPPSPARREPDEGYAAPRTPTEEVLLAIWEEVLHVEGVGIHDHFFQLGGHSLLATQVVSRIRQAFQTELPLRRIFERPSVAALAASIDDAVAPSASLQPLRPRSGDLAEPPLSFSQQRLWFLQQLLPRSPVYNLPGTRRFSGRLDGAALAAALAEVVRRHEVLRTRFPARDGRPWQQVETAGTGGLSLVDLTALERGRREGEARRRLVAEGRRPFRLAVETPLRAHLVRLGAEEHVLFVNTHHIASDGWSQGIFRRELMALYGAFVRGEPSPLPEPGVQYADFAVWQRGPWQAEALRTHLAYWRHQLDGLPALGLPADLPRPAGGTGRGAKLPLAVSEEVAGSLRRWSVEAGATLYMTLLAGFIAWLHRLTGQRDVAVGSPIANRRYEEVEDLIGVFVNTLVLRGRPRPRQSFRDLLIGLREVCLEAYRHQDLPFERLVEELDPERDLSRSPLFQVTLTFENAPRTAMTLPDVEVSAFPMPWVSAHFDLDLTLFEVSGGVAGSLIYNTDLFHPTTVSRFVRQVETLLSEVAADTSRPLGSLALLSAAERHQALLEWNDGESVTPASCLHDLFEAQVDRTPEAVALLWAGRHWSYRELDQRANRLAHHLRSLGVGPEERVGISVERSPAMLVGVLGILKAGAAYLPLDPQHPEARLLDLVADSGVKVLLTSAGLDGRFAAAGPGLRRVLLEPAGPGSPERPRRRAAPRNLAYVIYTSGSTGRPKAVAVEHRSAVHLARRVAADYPVEAGDRVLQLASLSFDASVEEIFPALLTGATLVLWDGGVPAVGELLDRLRELAVTVLALPTAYWHELVAQAEAEGLALPPALRRCVIGSERASGSRLRGWRRLAAPKALRLLNSYGPTEATVTSTWCVLSGPGTARYGEGDPPIGRPFAGVTAFVLDRGLRPVPRGAVGELCLGGAGLARGYSGRPALTAGSFPPHPLSGVPGSRLYRTGDLVRWRDDGQLVFLGRVDRQVKVRGYRIEPGEVEAALLAHPGVRQAAVVERRTSGSEPASLVGFYVAEGGESAEELQRFLAARLPSYMVPAFLLRADELPTTTSGKIDRRALATLAEAGPRPEASGAPPRTPTEEILTEIWAELLEVRGIGVRDDFFRLGGHSLLATQVVSRIRKAFAVELPVRSVFERPTLAALAAEVDDRRQAGEAGGRLPPPLVARRSGTGELSFAQQRLWFLQQLRPSSSVYNMPGARLLLGPLDGAALDGALREIVRRHETLRTRFPASDGRPRQEVLAAGNGSLPRVDLRSLPRDRRLAQVRHRLAVEERRPFSLEAEPPLRCHLWLVDAEEHVLFVNTHHVASDGWSQGIFNRELTALYEAFSRGEPSPLPEPAVQYADFALWQREWLQGEVLETQLDYWWGQLADLPSLELPADRPRPPVATDRAAGVSLVLPEELSLSLRRLAGEAGASLYMVLLAAFVALLHRTTGQNDIAVGSPIANRRQEEVEGLIGFFVNTLVLRSRPRPRQPFAGLLARVREVCLDAYLHQDLPFERLVEELDPERDLSRSPLFQVMLVLHNAPHQAVSMSGVAASEFPLGASRAHFDLVATFHDGGKRIAGHFSYDSDLFDATSMARLARRFRLLFESLAADPSRSLGSLDFLGAAERHQTLWEWNDTARPPSAATVVGAFARQAAATPEAAAVVFGDAVLSYRELDARARRLASRLRRLGVGRDTRVGLAVERSPEMAVAVLGILGAGAAYVPLDPSYPPYRLRFMLAEADVVLTQEALRGELAELAGEGTRFVGLDEGGDEAVEAWAEPHPESLAYVIYTSGSTGRPKGIALSHRALSNLIEWHLDVLVQGARTLQYASLSFDASFHEMFATWCSGGTLHVVSEELRRDVAALSRYLEARRIEKVILPVVVLHRLAEESLEHGLDLGGLAELTTTGEQLHVTPRVAELFERFPGIAFHNHYGPSETHVVTAATLSPRPSSWRPHPPIGRPIARTRIHLLDPSLSSVGVGPIGELYVGGTSLARGYVGRPALSAERFLPDPFAVEGGARLYRTGDQARWLADGTIEFLGRRDHQVKIRGFRVEVEEVEAVLARHPAVSEAAVVACGDDAADSAERWLAGFVVGSAAGLRAYLEERLPAYMVPRTVTVVEALPLSPTGKVDRGELSRRASAEMPKAVSDPAARTPSEEMLAEVWVELLGVREIGVRDDFFQLGGHSLLATQVVSRIRRLFGVELPVRSVFERPTVAGLAAEIDDRRRQGGGVRRPLSPRPAGTGEVPLSFAQKRLWFLQELTPGSSVYNMPGGRHLLGRLDADALCRALVEVVRRHETLRTRFPSIDGRPRQEVVDAAGRIPALVDLTSLPPGRRPAETRRRLAVEGRRPFRLAVETPLRAHVVRFGAEEHVLFVNTHHIASDGWSRGIFYRELTRIYEAFSRGEPSPLPELRVQYADYALWQRERLRGEELENQLAYWRTQLAGLESLDLPADRPRPPVQTDTGGEVALVFPEELSRSIRRLSVEAGVSLFMVLLAGFVALLHRLTGQSDVAVGSPIANRRYEEVEGLIGFFVNTLVLRSRTGRHQPFAGLLAQVREVCLDAYLHQDLPFEKLVEELHPERDLSRSPLFQVMVDLQNAPRQALSMSEVAVSDFPFGASSAHFDLVASFHDDRRRIAGSWSYNADLFDATSMERLARRFRRLFESLVVDPSRSLESLDLLGAAERHQAIWEWNDTARRRLHVLDARLSSVGLGQIGELYVGGVSLARGDVGRPALSAEKLLPDPFAAEAGARLYRTGDRARWLPDGTVELLGERKRLPAAERSSPEGSGRFVAPRDEVEEALARDLADLLGVERVGAHDDFFQIGGHSLLAVRWMSRIERRFAVRLPLDVLFRAPTVAGLARALGPRREGARRSPLVALQPAASGTPFFCVHPAGGHVLCFVHLCRELGPGQPFYGLEARGRNGAEPLPADLESMAADYVAAVRAARPEGPYLLGGWSMGGVVAYEMARQLRAAGTEVALLALIDSGPPADGIERLNRARNLEFFARELGLVETGDLLREPHGDALERILGAAREEGLLADDVESDRFGRLYHLFERNVRFMLRYPAKPYDGRITLFQSRRSVPRTFGAGWGKLAAGGVECHEVPGDHFSMLRPPQVRTLAERLRESLRRALEAP